MVAVVEHKGIGYFPGAVVNTDVDVRFFGSFAGFAGLPGTHVGF